MIKIKKLKKLNDLNELDLSGYKNIKNNDWEIPEKLEKYLTDNNFKQLGSGEFSTVWQSPTEKFVIKVYRSTEYNSSIDKQWYEYCRSNKGNPHLPKVGKLKDFGNWYVVFIEKLEPVPMSVDIPAMRIYSEALAELKPLPKTSKDYEYYEYEFLNIPYSLFHGTFDNDFLKKMLDAYPTVYDIYNKIVKPANSIQVRLDLHLGNVMMRGDTLVITDPIKSFLRNV